MASLKLSGIDKIYPSGTLALYDINLETSDREFIVILGAEESGKSTLLRVIAGLEEASSGKIMIGGKDVGELEPKDRDVAMVFRSNTLYPALTVYDNMAFGLRQRRASQALIDQRVKSVAGILGLTEVLYRKPKTLTAAQRQRVAIGRAVAREPKLYLLDEPLSGLDDNLKAELLNVIVNLQARMEGTFVYCTKNVAEALTIGTRVVVLKNGIIQQIDTPSNLYDYPSNAYVAFYIGSPTINFVNKAEIVQDADGAYAVKGNIKIPLGENVLKRLKSAEEYINTGKKVIAGIRPEDAQTGKEGIEAVVVNTETAYGADFAECEADGQTLTVKAAGAKNGEKILISIDPSRVYLFDAETRLSILERDEGYAVTEYDDADFKPLPFKDEEEIKEKFKKKDEKRKKLR